MYKYNVMQVANHIVATMANKDKPVTNTLLQRILYYSYAYVLVNKGEHLFSEPIAVWDYGPCCELVYRAFEYIGYDEYGDLSYRFSQPITEPEERCFKDENGKWSVEVGPLQLSNEDNEIVDWIAETLYNRFADDMFSLYDIAYQEPEYVSAKKMGLIFHWAYTDRSMKRYFGDNRHWPWNIERNRYE